MDKFEINIDPPQPSGGVVEIRGGGRGPGVAAIVVCLVIVVALVVAVGRSRDRSVAEPSTTTSVASTTTTIDSTTTTAPEETTTTVARTTTTVAPVQVYGPLLPDKTGVTLVVVQRDGHLVTVDVDSGTVTDLLPGERFLNVYQLVALRDGIVVTGDSGPRLIAGGEASILDNIDQLMGSPDGVQLVALRYSENARQVVLLTPGGSAPTNLPLPGSSDPVAVVPGGVALQSRAGGVYQVDLTNGAVHKIAEGAFVAAAGNRVASVTCDDALKCRMGIGPFGGRPTHQVAIAPDALDYGYYGLGSNALSPTRDLVAYLTSDGGRVLVEVLDLDTGDVALSVAMTSGPGNGPPFVWSADGRWLFWTDGGQVKAWSPDRGGEPLTFANNLAASADMMTLAYSG